MDTPHIRALAYCLIAGGFRAVAFAFAMARVSGEGAAGFDGPSVLDGPFVPFVATWSALAFLPCLALSAAELPLVRAFAATTASALEVRAIVTALVVGIGAGVLGAARLPWLSPVGPLWAACALAAGAIGGWLCPPTGRGDRPALAIAWAAVLIVLAGGVLRTDPFAPRPRPWLGPDPAPTVVAENDPDRARALVHAWIARHPLALPNDAPSEPGTALAIEGLVRVGRAHDDDLALSYARSWLEREVDLALAAGFDAGGAAALAALLELAADEIPDARARDGILALRTRVPRTLAGPPSAWGGVWPRGNTLETVSAYGLALARAARIERDLALHREARAMWDETQRALGHDPSRLLRHAWLELGLLDVRLPVEPVFWARGQALALRFLAEHVRYDRELVREQDPEIARELVRFALALIERQDPCGLWPADLDRASGAPLDVSASALLAATLARARATGALPSIEVAGLDEAIARATVGLRRAILWDAGIPRVAGATRDPVVGYGPLYRVVDVVDDEPHAIGAVLLWLAGDKGSGPRRKR